jgi:hypothetical protein
MCARWTGRMLADEHKQKVKETVMAANVYDERIIKLVQCLDKCLNHNRDHVEK